MTPVSLPDYKPLYFASNRCIIYLNLATITR